ncbi:hypothetical protein [Terriglobus sp. TAA 43]|uniref:hypothetical protein n=1 Tax=Terriglobus sp. TAA 43 TaxID=278961 RepID=UPI0006480C7F|nr:hypothetical protein [Terriglobus sp. TAA 43]
MPMRRGITLLELLPLPAGAESLVPDEIASQLNLLTVLDYRSMTTATAFVHTGTAQAMLDALNVNTRGYVFRAPGITDGLKFRLAVARPNPLAANSTTIESVGQQWQLDLFLDPVELQLPFRAGDLFTNEEGLVTVQPDPGRQNVWLVGSAVLRVAGDPTGHVTVEFVDQPDPFDMNRPTGPVVDLTVSPPTFVFGSTQYGMTLDRFEIDASSSYTPPDVMARGQDEAWQGVAFREATFYAPPTTPIVGALSIGLRDVIIGTPFGMQGEMAIQLGQDPSGANFATVTAVRETATGQTNVPIPAGTNGTVQLPVDETSGTASYHIEFVLPAGPVPPPGGNPPGTPDNTPRGIWWQLPNGVQGTSLTTPAFAVPNPGDPSAPLKYRIRVGEDAPTTPGTVTTVPDGQVELSEVDIVFQGPTVTVGPAANPPAKVTVTQGGTTWANVASIAGPHDRIAALAFGTNPSDDGARWQFDNGSSGTGSTPQLTIPTEVGTHNLVMTSNQATRNVRVEITSSGALFVGHGHGPSGNADVAIDPDPLAYTVQPLNKPNPPNPPNTPDPGHTFDLRTYNSSGSLVPSAADATYAGSGDPLTVPDGTVAQLTITWTDDGTQANQSTGSTVPSSPSAPPATQPNPHFAVYNYNVNDPTPPPGSHQDLIDWATSALPTGSGAPARVFYVVGRTDDLWLDAKLPSNTSNNALLATKRATGIASFLTSNLPAGAAFSVLSRGEQDGATGLGWPIDLDGVDSLARSGTRNAVPSVTPSGSDHPVWKSGWSADSSDVQAHATAESASERGNARRVDVYISPTTAPGVNVPANPGGSHSGSTPQPRSRTMLVPGEDTPNPPTVKRTLDQASTHRPWMMRLAAKWDSPVVATLADAIPTDCELTVAWTATDTTLPRSAGTVPPPAPQSSGSNIWLLQGKWTYDARSGENAFTLALTLPDSVLTFNSDFLAWALALAPALSGLLPASDAAGELVSFVGLMVVGGVVGSLINGSSGKNADGSAHPHVDSKLHIHRLELDYHGQSDNRVRFALDYTTELNVNFSMFGQSLVGDGLKMKFKNVVLEVDFTSTTLESVRLDYTQFSVEVENPGTWALGGTLGNLLNISNPRSGSSSTWIQFDLKFAIDLGVIQLNGATIRLTMNGPNIGFEIRGLNIGVDIPGTLSGQGALSVGDDGSLRGMISVTIIPTKLSAYASLAIDPPMVALEMGVQLPVGIPLASSGLAIYGFIGRFVANGQRNLLGLPTSDPTQPTFDPVQRELDWYCRAPQDKYSKLSGEFALGVGVIIGTMPDGGTTFNAQGMIAVSFPDVSVDLGIDAMLMSQRKSAATEQGDSSETGSSSNRSFRILGVVVVNPDSLILGVRGSYKIERVLELEIPINGYFPFHSNGPGGDCYFRVGSDGVTSEGRTGTPVQIKLFPGTLDVSAWSFLMIEERKLHKLGNDPTLNFDGFSIGFGAGFNLDWGSHTIGLHAGAKMLLGVGTNPLTFAGMIGVNGEIDLVIITLSFEGDIHFIIADQASGLMWHLHGHFCASIDCFFFSISGCVDIDFGSDGGNPIPTPKSPILGVDLTDHLGAVKGKAIPSGAGQLPTVWPDTIPVAHFAHYAVDTAASAGVFNRLIDEPATDNPWSGTNDLKYAFQLVSVELWKYPDASFTGGTQITDAGLYDSAWWLPTHRPGVATPDNSASPLEGRELGFMWWNPAPWSRWLSDGSESVPGDPSQTWGNVCDPPPAPKPVCALGQNAVQLDHNTAQFVPLAPSPGPFSSFFTVSGGLPADVLATLQALVAAYGLSITPAGVRNLAAPLNLPNGVNVTAGYMLQLLMRQGRLLGSAPFAGRFSATITRCSLVLLVCPHSKYDVSGCDDFTDQSTNTQLPNPYNHNGLVYESLDSKPLTVNAQHGALFSTGVKVTLPQAVSSVTVTVAGLKSPAFVVTALNSSGKIVAKNTGAPTGDAGPVDITVSGDGIVVVMVRGGARASLIRVCWTLSGTSMLQTIYGRTAAVWPSVPTVFGTGADNKQIAWNAKVIGTPPLSGATVPTNLSAVYIPPKCQLVVYTPPDTNAVWNGFEIEPIAAATVEILSVCGITVAALQAQQQDAAVRNSLQNAWNNAANLASGNAGAGTSSGTPNNAGDNGPNSTRTNLFDKDSYYELRLTWQWQGWRSDPSNSAAQNPPLPLPGTWTNGTTDLYRFHTAKEQVSTPNPHTLGDHFITDPTQAGAVYDESVFDAHGIARYLIGFSPAPNDPPHYLDDDILASFNADHIQTLLDIYARTLRIKVRRTDPPPGTFSAAKPDPNGPIVPVIIPKPKHALDVHSSASWGPLPKEMMYAADARAEAAASAAPCLNGNGAFGGTQATIKADLLPDAEYDILLVAAPNNDLELDEVLVERSHFITSSYRNPQEQFEAMGFALGTPVPWAPHDFEVTAIAPTATLYSDASLVATLAAMGFTSEPVPPLPQATALWRAPVGAGPWQLAGLLLESDEPLLRDGRLSIVNASLAGAGSLSLWACNQSATRVLLATASPFNVPAGSNVLNVTFQKPSAATQTVSRVLFERPLTRLQEGA